MRRRMDERRCGICDTRLMPYERQTFAGILFVRRYACGECGTRFDLATGFGEVVLLGLTGTIFGVVALSPASRFASASDRTWILVIVALQLIAGIVAVVRSRRRARLHPPLS